MQRGIPAALAGLFGDHAEAVERQAHLDEHEYECHQDAQRDGGLNQRLPRLLAQESVPTPLQARAFPHAMHRHSWTSITDVFESVTLRCIPGMRANGVAA